MSVILNFRTTVIREGEYKSPKTRQGMRSVYEIEEQQSYLPNLEVSEYILILKYKERKKKNHHKHVI